MALTGSSARAGTFTWDTATAGNPVVGGPGAWDLTATNWTQDGGTSKVLWGNTATDVAIFGDVGGAVTLGAPITANALQFDVTGYSIAQGTGTLTFAGTTPTVTVTNLADTATISAAILGSSGLTKAGAGTLVLSGTNTFTGGLNLNAGTLSTTALGQLGGGTITFNGGTLRTGAAITISSLTNGVVIGAGGGTLDNVTGTKVLLSTAAGVLSGSGTFTRNASANNVIAGAGHNTLQISVANVGFTGAVVLNGGQNEISTNGLGNGLTVGNTITINPTAELTASNGTIANPLIINGGNIGGDNGTSTFSGPITVNGAFGIRLGDFHAATQRNLIISNSITGTGAITFLNANTNTVGNGVGQTLFLNGANGGYTSAINVPAGFNVSFGTAASYSAGTLTINSSAAAIGGIGVGYDFGATLPTFTNTRTGTTTGGVFAINTTLAATTTVDLATLGGGGMFLGSNTTGNYAATTLGADGGIYRLGGGLGNLTLSGTNVLTSTNALVIGEPATTRVNATGTITLSAANDYTGTTTINPGSTLQVSNSAALGSIATGTTVVAGGSLALTGGINVAEPLVLNGTSATGSTTNIPNGLVNVSGTNTFSGAITANSSSANVRISTTAGTLNLPGTISLSGGGTSTGLVFTGGGTISQTGTISGNGTVISTSTGTSTLSATNTYSGKTQVQQGTISTPSINSVTGGSASSGLGAPTTVAAGTIDLGSTTTGGTLAYTGTGETTDRVINLLGTTGGGAITQSGTGLLKFTSNLTATGAGTKTFTLQGSTAGTGEFAGAIVNNSGTNLTNLTKAGSGTWTLSGANTYSGVTTISGGNLIISSIANVNAGVPTSLGNPTTTGNGTINMGATTTAGTLTYIGTGSTSDRNINLAGTTAGATIDHAGIGTLQFGGVTATGGGTKTLTLQGSTGSGVIAGVIANNSGTNLTNVAKSGLGTWTLAGANTYTGTTTVNAGLLQITGNSSAATGAVTVNTGGSLGGTGSLGGAVTAAAGGSLDFRDGNVGTLTLGSTLTFNGTAALANRLYFDLGNAAGSLDKIAATGAVTASTAGSVLISFNQLAGAPIPDGTYTLITSGATSVPTGFALATTQSGGHTYALTTNTSGNVLQVTIGTAVAGPAAAFWGGTTSGVWTAAGNWYTDATSGTPTGAAPGVGTNVTFNTTTPVAGNLATTLGADAQINSLNFASTATTAVTIGPATNALTIDASNANGNTAGNGISQLAAATHTIASRVGIATAQTWTVASGGGLTISGLVFDTGPGFTLTKAGPGTLTLSGTANTFGGDINVTEGVLAFAGNAGANGDPLSLGGGNKLITVTNNAVVRPTSNVNPTATNTKRFAIGAGGGTFDVPTGVTFQLDDAGQFSGSGDLTVTGAGIVYLNNQSFNFTGNVFVNSGTLRLGTNAVLGTTAGRTITVASGASLDVNNTNTTVPLSITLNGTGISSGGALTAATAAGTLASPITLASASSIGGASTLTLSGPIGGPFGLTKVGAGTTVLSGTNTYNAPSGATTTVTAGMLHATKTAALPNYLTAGQVSVTGGALAMNVGGAGEFTAGDVTTLLGNGTFASGTGIGLDTTNAGGSFTAPALTTTPAVAVLNLTKLGTGTLNLPSANGFGTGSTTVFNGTLAVTSGVNNALGTGALVLGAFNGTPGALDLGTSNQTFTTITAQSNSATPNTIAIGPGNTLTNTGAVTIGANPGTTLTTNLTVTGATGTWSVGTVSTATNANFQIGANTTTNVSNGSTVDLSGLGTFYANLGTGTFRVGDATNAGGTATLNSTLILAPTSTIRATTLTSDSPDSGRTETIRLGAGVNTLNANTINIGGTVSGRANGVLEFLGATGSVIVRNLAGTGRADMSIAYGATTTGAAPVSTVNLLAHNADMLLNNLNVGGRTGTSSGSSTGTFSFDTGTLDVNTINIARRNVTDSAGGTIVGTSTGTVNIGGGIVTVNTGVVIAQNTSTLVSNPTNGTLNISGGTVGIGGTNSITLGSSANATNGPATANLNLTGGVTTLAGNIISNSATGVTATVTLNGGTLNMTGKTIGSATNLVNLVAQSGTLDRLGELNGGGALNKTGAGTLAITGTSTYTGATTVSAGTLLVNGSITSSVTANAGTVGGTGTIAGTLTVNAATLAPGTSPGILSTTGTVALAAASVYAVEIGGNTAGTYDQTITSAGGANTLTLAGGQLSVIGVNDYATSDNTSDVSKAAFILVQGGVDPVAGTFAGLPTDGSLVTFADGGSALITYSAKWDPINGNALTGGNDVALYNINLVPEPASLGLLALGGIGLLARRGRRTSRKA